MRVVLVTGAAGALGSRLVDRYLADGAWVVATDLDPPQGTSERLIPATADLAVPADIAGLVELVDGRFGRLDVLVNCAGLAHRSPAVSTDPEIFRRVMAVNWEGPMRLTQLAFPLLARAGGAVVNLGSMAGWMPVLGRAAYGASKAALSQFMEVLRHEAQHQGIHVLTVYPAFLDTVMADASGDVARSRTSTGRIMSVDEMADRIMAAEAARRRWVFPDRPSRLASVLYRVWPGAYHRLMGRRFADELGATSSRRGGLRRRPDRE